MATEVTTIEKIIRERAHEEFEQRVSNHLNAFFKFRQPRFYDDLGRLKLKLGESEYSVYQLMDLIKLKMRQTYIEPNGDEAVKAFIEKVDTIQAELDSLKDSVQYQREG